MKGVFLMGKGVLYQLAQVLLIIGSIGWGLVGLSGLLNMQPALNLMDMILGANSGLTNIAYLLLGIAGLYVIYGMTQKD